MSSTAQSYPALAYGPLRLPMAAFEVLGYLSVIAVATLCFLAGWLPVNGAVVLTVILLTTLIVLSWIHLGQGRHPRLLFLCSLALFQGGRLIGYCLGGEPHPMRVVAMTSPFDISREDAGLTLLALSLSAICIYAPCRWMYRSIAPPSDVKVRRYLPYLYILFVAALPVQLFKNYRYYEYAQQHGGYLFIYVSHSALASSVPFLVRVIPVIALPVFVAIFVFERRRFPLYLATALYFTTASLILLLGSRSGPFMLVASLWWVARVKSQRKTRIAFLAVFVVVLLLAADVIQKTRGGDEQDSSYRFTAVDLIISQGISLNTTEVALKYPDLFSPYFGSYLLTELQNAFVASEASASQRGKSLAVDISGFLNPAMYRMGYGTAGAYIPEAYIGGDIIAVVVVSVALGLGLHALYKFSGNVLLLFLFAMSLPDILLMPKGQLLDWVSVLMRNGISVVLLWVGWKICGLLLSIGRTSPAPSSPGMVTT